MHTKTASAPKILRRAALAAAVVVGAIALVLASLGTAQAFTKSDTKATNGVSGPQQQRATMVDHGGAVLTSARVHVIWWGPAAGFPAGQRATVQGLLGSLEGSAYLGTVAPYLRGAVPHVQYDAATDWADPSTPPAAATADAVAAAVARSLAATGQKADPQGIYVVYSTARVSGDSCAWHDVRAVAGGTALVNLAYVPDATGASHCDLGAPSSAASPAALSAASSTAHEVLETMSDPIPGATWTDSSADDHEIADPCSGTVVQVHLAGSLSLPLQTVWSNTAHACTAG